MTDQYMAIRQTWVRRHEDDILRALDQDLGKTVGSVADGLITRPEFAQIARSYIADAVASISEVHDRLLHHHEEGQTP